MIKQTFSKLFLLLFFLKRVFSWVVAALALLAAMTWFLHGHKLNYPDTPNSLTPIQGSAKVDRMKLRHLYNDEKPPFIGIALSGGGSRAANFSWAVLRELDRIGLLENAEAISSVSGGSLAAAYLALNLDAKPTDEFWNKGFDKLYADFARPIFWQSIYKYPLTIATNYNRGDILAGVLEKDLLKNKNGLPAKFSDLPQGSSQLGSSYLPSLFITATMLSDPWFRDGNISNLDPRTSMGTYMSTFIYSYERFDSMSSDLQTMPLSYAVASSAAFPGLLNPITLTMGQRIPAMGDGSGKLTFARVKKPRYIHLADGGLSDNLGTDTLRKVLEVRSAGNRKMQDDGSIKEIGRACLIISIDATTLPNIEPSEYSLSRDSARSWRSSIIDQTLISGYDAYLLRRRADQLNELGIDIAAVNYNKLEKNRPTPFVEIKGIRHRNFRYIDNRGNVTGPSVFNRDLSASPEEPPTHDFNKFNCHVWHIALEDMAVRKAWDVAKTQQSRTPEHDKKVAAAKQRDAELSTFSDAVLSFETDFKLVSDFSPTCDRRDLQSMLVRSAQELVFEDEVYQKACTWIESSLKGKKCGARPAVLQPVNTGCVVKRVNATRDYVSKL
jgi:NTE family protein